MCVTDPASALRPRPKPDGSASAFSTLDQAAGCRCDQGLSRRQRVLASTVFREAFQGGRRFSGRWMRMWLTAGDTGRLRLGVVASKRSFRRAVDRARARRLLREAFRLNRFRLRGRCDVIIVAKREILHASRAAVEAEILALAGKAGVVERAGGI